MATGNPDYHEALRKVLFGELSNHLHKLYHTHLSACITMAQLKQLAATNDTELQTRLLPRQTPSTPSQPTWDIKQGLGEGSPDPKWA